MDFYLYALLIISFLQENITSLAVIFCIFILLVGFFIGWLVGHIRNNESTRTLMDALEQTRWQLKHANDHGVFLDHEVSVLNKELDRRQHIIDAYKIGESFENTVLNGDYFTHDRTNKRFYCSGVSKDDPGQIISVTLVDSPDKLSAIREITAQQFIETTVESIDKQVAQ